MVIRALSDFEYFERGRIVKIRGKGDFHRRLCKMGLVVGAVIEMGRLGAQADLVEVRVNKDIVLLHRNEITGIHIETK